MVVPNKFFLVSQGPDQSQTGRHGADTTCNQPVKPLRAFRLDALSLLNLTPLTPAAVVGTDLAFGQCFRWWAEAFTRPWAILNVAVLMKLLSGGVVGAIGGAMLSSRLPSKKLRFVLCLMLVVLGAQLTYNSARKVIAENAARKAPSESGSSEVQVAAPTPQAR
jgi:hypothetical protein